MPAHLKMYCIQNEFSRMQKFAFYSAVLHNNNKSSYILAYISNTIIQRAATHMKGTKFFVRPTVDRVHLLIQRISGVHIRKNILMMKIMKQWNEIVQVKCGVSFGREV